MPPIAANSGQSRALAGIAWMVLYTLLMSGMHSLIKLTAATGLHAFEIAFFRLLFGLFAVVPWFVRHGTAPLKTDRLGLLGLRAALNSVAILCYFLALTVAPLAQVTALGFSAPIFATVLAVFILGEVVGIRRWAAIVIGFAGTLVILRPGAVPLDLGSVLTLTSSLFWGACIVIIRQLSQSVSSVTVTIYMSLFMAPVILVPALFVWQWPTWQQLALMAVLGTLGSAGQMAMTEALRRADTHVVGPVDFVRLIWVSTLGYLIFAEVPNLFIWVGGAMILGSTVYIAYREHRLSRPAPPA